MSDSRVLALVKDLPEPHMAQYEFLLKACEGLASFHPAIPNNDAFAVFSSRKSILGALDELRSQHLPLNELNRNISAAFESRVAQVHRCRPSDETSQATDLIGRWRAQVALDNHYLGPKFAIGVSTVMRKAMLECELPPPELFDGLIKKIPDQVLSRPKLSALVRMHSIGEVLFAGLERALHHVQFERLEIQKLPLIPANQPDTIAISIFLSDTDTPPWGTVSNLAILLERLGCLPFDAGVRRTIRVGNHSIFCQGYNGLKDLLCAIGRLENYYSPSSNHALRNGVVSQGVLPSFS